MSWTVTTPPASEPVTLAEAKAHLRVDTTDSDDTITALIASARQFIELTCNRALMAQTWAITLPSFGRGAIRLPGNVRAIDSITYYDANNVEQTLTDYQKNLAEPAKLTPDDVWPDTYCRPDAVTITAQVGYADADSVPGPIKEAIKLQIELVFDRPVAPAAEAIERARDALLSPYRDGGMI